MISMTNEQRSLLKSAIRSAIRAKGEVPNGIGSLTKDQLIVKAQELDLDLATIIAVPANTTTMEEPAIEAIEPAAELSPQAQAELDGILANWDDMSPKAFKASIKDLVERAHKPAERIVETIEVAVPAPLIAGQAAVAPAMPALPAIVQAKRTGTIELGKLFAGCLDSTPSLSAMTTSLWSGGINVPDVMLDHVWPDDIAALASQGFIRGRPVYFAGPKGVGKTTTVEQVAARLGRPFIVISCSEETELPELIGTLVPHDGRVRWQDGALLAAMRLAGAIILLDEIDTLRTGVAIGLAGILENRHYTVPQTGENVEAADGVMFVGAGNSNGRGDTTGRYGSSQEQSAALMNRFRAMVTVAYLSSAKEQKLLCTRTGCNRELAKLLVGAANITRQAVNGGELADGMSFRTLQSWTELLLDGLSPDMAARAAFLNGASIEEAEKLHQILLTHAAPAMIETALSGQNTLGRGAGDFTAILNPNLSNQ